MTTPHDNDRVFAGSIPEVYEKQLVPLIFEPYATDLAERLKARKMSRILEVACGTGVVTRALASGLDAGVSIVATDLNPAMLARASATGTARPVEWREADALALPFADESFDAVVCQFGVMFFPDKPKAFSEAHRVLRPGGMFIFNVWDKISENKFADAVTGALEEMFPGDPPQFLSRTPHGYHDAAAIGRDLERSAFAECGKILTVAARSRAHSPRIPAVAYCQGTPLRGEIEARDPSLLATATDAAEARIAERFGTGAVDGKIQAHVVSIERNQM